MKIFKVTIHDYSYSYVVAEGPDEAYKIVRDCLDKRGFCASADRELRSIELLAEVGDYPDCGTRLFIKQGKEM